MRVLMLKVYSMRSPLHGHVLTNRHSAAIRSAMGHPEPFTLNYIEIGNEDFFSPTTWVPPKSVTYWCSLDMLLDTLITVGQLSSTPYLRSSLNSVSTTLYIQVGSMHCTDPSLDYIATSATSGDVPALSPAPTYWDLHIYSDPGKHV